MRPSRSSPNASLAPFQSRPSGIPSRIFLSASLLAATGCSGDAGSGVASHADGWATTDSAGVAIVSERIDPGREIRLEEVWRVGSLEGDEASQFFAPRDAILTADRAYVLDAGNHRVKVFDLRSGAFIFGFGSEGQGPGEFEGRPFRIALAAARIVIQDSGQRLHQFELDGTLVRTVATGTILEAGHIIGMPSPAGERWLAPVTRYFDVEKGESLQRSPTVLRVVDFEAGTLGDSLRLSWDYGVERESVGSLGWIVTPLFEPRARFWFDGQSRLFRTAREGYGWEVWSPEGSLLRRVTVETERVPVDPGDVERYREDETRQCRERPRPACEGYIAEALPVILDQPLPEFKPVVSQLDGTDEGDLLVLRADLGNDLIDGFQTKTYELFAPDGRFRGRFTMPSTFRVIAIDQERILAVERDELDVESVVLYRWSEPGSG